VKELLAICATLLIILAYVPYVKDIAKGKTLPHIYSWLVSSFVGFIAFGLQITKHAGWGVLPTFVGSVAGTIIFLCALRGSQRAKITKADSFFFALALITTGLWLIADQLVLSVILISSIDILAFVPTYRKSWIRPDQETASSYGINAVRFSLASAAIQNFNFVTLLYPVSQALVDALFAVFLLVRRKRLHIT
jgi:hypothetical protein